MGHQRATKVEWKGKLETAKEAKRSTETDNGLKLDSLKMELLVIVNKNVTVKLTLEMH